MANIERRQVVQTDLHGRRRKVVRYKIRYRANARREHSETKGRLVDAERRKAEIETELAGTTWRDPRRGEIKLKVWADEWVKTRHDLRPTTWARLETTMKRQVLPRFGETPLDRTTNATIRSWVAELLASGLSAATTRKAVFALRQCLDAAVADNRLGSNPALRVPLPSERAKQPRFCPRPRSSVWWRRCQQYKALVLVGA